MPGVVVTTKATNGTGTALTDNSGQFFIVGLAERGESSKAVLVRGLADFEIEFGGRTTYGYLHDAVRMFFEEGGEQAHVARVVGKAPVVATVSALDTATVPVNTLVFKARSAGEWGNDITVEVAAGGITDTVRVSVITEEDEEVFDNLASPTEVVAALSRSTYVFATDSGSVTVSPKNNPAVGTYQLAGGADDRMTVDNTSYVDALNLFDIGLGSGAVAIPGVGNSVHAALIDHATRNRRIALLTTAVDTSIAALRTLAGGIDSKYAGLFAPWVNVTDSYGGTRTVSPEGYIAACRSRAHKEYGAERAPAGALAISRSIVSLSKNYTADEANILDNAKVSVIRNINNTNRLYGWRSLSTDAQNWRYLNGADLMNYLTFVAENELEQFVFASVDGKGQLLSAMHGALAGIVEPIAARGGLYPFLNDAGEEIDPGYVVDTGSSVNSVANLRNNEVRARLGFRLAPTGALISLTIVKANLTSGF